MPNLQTPRDSHPCTCPRRMNEDGPWEHSPNLDFWKDWVCSFCGSLHPEAALRRIEEGALVAPTDKPYKMYVGDAKFYFQHFTSEDCDRFITLYNAKRMNLAAPGYFYVLPYFCRLAPRADANSSSTSAVVE